jgi:bifunctional DNA-binding transcriptional regulator/antitoxin component of YhaV-PrlF toxin-antitoxin module
LVSVDRKTDVEAEAVFTAKVDKAWKIWVPKAVRELLSLDRGDYVEARIRVVKRSYARRGEI